MELREYKPYLYEAIVWCYNRLGTWKYSLDQMRITVRATTEHRARRCIVHDLHTNGIFVRSFVYVRRQKKG